jgi:ADP-ribose pyrophosphatase YjhB (NUDIX family)
LNGFPMNTLKHTDWTRWCARLQALAQTGLTFARDPYDVERYKELREIAAQMLAAGSQAELPELRRWLQTDTGYATPKVDVRGVIFRDKKLLLVRERSDGLWTLPGGWADVGESPAENVVREVREETGFETRVTKLLAVFDRARHPHEPPFPFHVYKIFLLCEITGGAAQQSSETSAVAFFGETELPELSLTRITPWQIRRMFEHARDESLPTDFDTAI